jgi:isopentenyl-diphosphate Delta-isomerase
MTTASKPPVTLSSSAAANATSRTSGNAAPAPVNIGSRKADHLRLCAEEDVGFREHTTLFDDVELVHDSLPELDLASIDTSVTLFGKTLRAPLLVAAMTGGTEEAAKVNRELAAVADKLGLAFGLGSQRAMYKRPESAPTFRVRDGAPNTLVFGNIGIMQAKEMRTDEVLQLARDVGADAICVHLNPAMEVVQTEGDRDFRGGVEVLSRLVRELPIPVIAKETGSGISMHTAHKLHAAGVRNVDISGAGGTSWVGVEALRAQNDGDRNLGHLFWDWGVPTAGSLLQVAPYRFDTVIATGGIRHGLDAARAIALGANLVGIARPVLQAWSRGGQVGAEDFLRNVERALRVTMLLTGSASVAELQTAPRFLSPRLEKWRTAPARR